MSTRPMRTSVSNRAEILRAARCTTPFCTAGTASSSDSTKGTPTAEATSAKSTFADIFVTLRIGWAL